MSHTLDDQDDRREPPRGTVKARASDDAEAQMATVTITPGTRGIGLLEFHQFDAARDAGVRAGEAAVTALREQGWVVPPTANDATPDVGTQSAALTPG